MACVRALGAIWGTWFAAFVAACIYGDVSHADNAEVLPYLVWILGLLLASVLSIVVCAAIACEQCFSRPSRRAPSA
jgi:predicted outer membrane lipoprotein